MNHPLRTAPAESQRSRRALMLAAALLAASTVPVVSWAQETDLVPLPHKLPKPAFAGTPSDAPEGSNVEKPLGKPRPVPLVPKGTTNLALKKKATSAKPPFYGSLDVVTDGNKEPEEGRAVELRPRTQWLQIDLGAPSKLFYVLFWHYHMDPVIFRDVVVQISNDPNFVEGVTTLFNNDVDNSSQLGLGKDREYFETSEGKLVDAKGATARYVRLYSNGSTYRDPLNRYTEVEVYGLPPQ